MRCLLEIHFEWKIFQYLMNFTHCLIKFISITQKSMNQMPAVPQTHTTNYGESSFKLLNQNQQMYGNCAKGT